MKNQTELHQDIILGRQEATTQLIALAVVAVMAWFFYGERSLRLLFAGAAAALCAELLAQGLFRRLRKPLDYHSLVVGACIAMMLPANAPYTVAIVGSVFAVWAVKLPFGGTMHAPFVPAAAGFAFLCLCFPKEVFSYPQMKTITDITVSAAAWGDGTSLASLLQNGQSTAVGSGLAASLLIGNARGISGPMGTGCILVLLLCLLLPVMRKPRTALGPLGFLFSCAVLAFAFPRVQMGRWYSVLFELCAGMLVFAAVFFITDSATSPDTGGMRLLYGILAGVLCMLFRYFGVYEEGVCFAVLAANALWPIFEDGIQKLLSFLPGKSRTLERKEKTY